MRITIKHLPAYQGALPWSNTYTDDSDDHDASGGLVEAIASIADAVAYGSKINVKVRP